jgi:hypothetical protein
VTVFAKLASPTFDRVEVGVSLDGPGQVRSGDVLHTGLRIQNLGVTSLEIHTNRSLTALIFNSKTGDVVGSYSGAQILPLKIFYIDPGGSTTIPLLVGTDSFIPELGFVVPEGEWQMAADLKLGRAKWCEHQA